MQNRKLRRKSSRISSPPEHYRIKDCTAWWCFSDIYKWSVYTELQCSERAMLQKMHWTFDDKESMTAFSIIIKMPNTGSAPSGGLDTSTRWKGFQTFSWKTLHGSLDLFPTWNELPHDKTNKMTCAHSEDSDQPSICPVWSEASMSAWKSSGSLATHELHSEDWSDWQQRLWRGWSESSMGARLFVVFVVRRLNLKLSDF